jgi:hypothetical protein
MTKYEGTEEGEAELAQDSVLALLKLLSTNWLTLL